MLFFLEDHPIFARQNRDKEVLLARRVINADKWGFKFELCSVSNKV